VDVLDTEGLVINDEVVEEAVLKEVEALEEVEVVTLAIETVVLTDE
jgi:hypothetical protein